MSQLIAIADLAESLGLVPSTHIMAHNHHIFSSRRSDHLIGLLQASGMHEDEVDMHTYGQNTHTQNKNK